MGYGRGNTSARGDWRRFAIRGSLLLMVLCVLGSYHYTDKAKAFADGAVQTEGSVIKSTVEPCELFTYCGRHNRYRHIAEIGFVDGDGEHWAIIENVGSYGTFNRSPVGKIFTVWYVSDNPEMNFIGDKGFAERSWFIARLALLVGTLFFAGLAAWFYLAYSEDDFPAGGDNYYSSPDFPDI